MRHLRERKGVSGDFGFLNMIWYTCRNKTPRHLRLYRTRFLISKIGWDFRTDHILYIVYSAQKRWENGRRIRFISPTLTGSILVESDMSVLTEVINSALLDVVARKIFRLAGGKFGLPRHWKQVSSQLRWHWRDARDCNFMSELMHWCTDNATHFPHVMQMKAQLANWPSFMCFRVVSSHISD